MPEPNDEEVHVHILNCISLPVLISSCSGLKWSEDYQLAIATKKGVYVFEIIPNAKRSALNVNYVKTFIENDMEVNPWQLINGVPFELLSQLPREMRNSVTMDRVISPNMIGGEATFRQVAKVGWAPRLEESESKCLLVTLTVDFRFRFLKLEGRQWSTELELSQILFEYFKDISLEENQRNNSDNSNFSEHEITVKNIKKRCYNLATNCWCWKNRYEFFTGQLSGHVVHWQRGKNTVVKKMFKTDLDEIACVQFNTLNNMDILLVCGKDGRVVAYKLSSTSHSLFGWIWNDLDRMPVENVVIDQSRNLLLLAKANFGLSLKYKITRSRIEITKTNHINTGLTKIVGMEAINDKLFVANQKSPFKLWDMKDKTTVVDVDIAREHYFCYGVAGSPNQSIFACLENISSFNDHLIMREPGRLVFWTFETLDSLQEKLKDGLLGPDIMESYRLLVLKNKLDVDPNISISSDINNCRFDWWHHSVLNARTTQKSQKLINVLEQCEIVLRSQAAKHVLTSQKKAFEQAALEASAGFVLTFTDCVNLKKIATEVLEKIGVSRWTCRICGSLEKTDSLRVSFISCLSGHIWPRCVSTQQPVSVTRPARCCWCKSLAVDSSAIKCSLCLGPLL